MITKPSRSQAPGLSTCLCLLKNLHMATVGTVPANALGHEGISRGKTQTSPAEPPAPTALTTLAGSVVFLGALIRSHFLFALGLLSRMFFLTTLRSLFLPGMYPSFKEMSSGSASLPSNHSSASSAASGPAVSGYRSSWKRSDCGRQPGGKAFGKEGEAALEHFCF